MKSNHEKAFNVYAIAASVAASTAREAAATALTAILMVQMFWVFYAAADIVGRLLFAIAADTVAAVSLLHINAATALAGIIGS